MKLQQTYLKAFTLTEIMVVMALSAIVVGIAFSVLSLVQKSMKHSTENYEYHSHIKALEVGLTLDIHRCTQMQWDANTETLTLSSPIQTLQYQFYVDSIVTPITTHPLKIKHFNFYYSGNLVKSGTIDAIEFHFEHTLPTHRTFVFQYTDPTSHFKRHNPKL